MIEIDYTGFDFDNPHYESILEQRQTLHETLVSDPNELEKYKRYYAKNPWLFINHWATIYDPKELIHGDYRNVPFVPSSIRQKEAINWMYYQFTKPKQGVLEPAVLQSAEGCGVTWLALYFAVWVYLFSDYGVVCFGGVNKRDIDDPKNLKSIIQRILSVFEFDRIPECLLPDEFKPRGLSVRKYHKKMQLAHPCTHAMIEGETGNDIGYGEYSMYFVVDAHLHKNKDRIDFNLALKSGCQIDITTHKSLGTKFQQKIDKLIGTSRHFKLER